MGEAVDEHFVEHVRRLTFGAAGAAPAVDGDVVLALFDAQAQSREAETPPVLRRNLQLWQTASRFRNTCTQ